MCSTTPDRLRELIAELDDLVPRDDARVRMVLGAEGPGESEMNATERGYLRLGVEFMKAPFSGAGAGQAGEVACDIDGLITLDSDISFDVFTCDPALGAADVHGAGRNMPLADLAAGLGCLSAMVAVLGLALVGFLTLVGAR